MKTAQFSGFQAGSGKVSHLLSPLGLRDPGNCIALGKLLPMSVCSGGCSVGHLWAVGKGRAAGLQVGSLQSLCSAHLWEAVGLFVCNMLL